MSLFSSNRVSYVSSSSRVGFDTGLRDYMYKVYNNMSVALAISGFVAFLLSKSATMMQMLFGTPLKYLIMFAPLAFVLFFSFKINSISASQARTYLYSFAAIMGLSISSIFLIYTGQSIVRVFLITSCTFGLMSLYGYTTKKDLTALGSFLIMGVVGIVIASLVNIFLKSAAIHFAISAIGVLVFTLLAAYDTQKIKNLYYQVSSDEETINKAAVMGSLSLYMDFINMFMFMLQFLGQRRD